MQRPATSVLLLLLAAHAVRADDAAAPPGKPLPRRPAGDASAGVEYTRIGDAADVGGASAAYAIGQHAVLRPKQGMTADAGRRARWCRWRRVRVPARRAGRTRALARRRCGCRSARGAQ